MARSGLASGWAWPTPRAVVMLASGVRSPCAASATQLLLVVDRPLQRGQHLQFGACRQAGPARRCPGRPAVRRAGRWRRSPQPGRGSPDRPQRRPAGQPAHCSDSTPRAAAASVAVNPAARRGARGGRGLGDSAATTKPGPPVRRGGGAPRSRGSAGGKEGGVAHYDALAFVARWQVVEGGSAADAGSPVTTWL